MSSVLRRAATNLRGDQSGFTLVELLIGSMLALLIAFAALNFSEIATRSETSTGERTEALGQARVALERRTRELRQGIEVVPGTQYVDFRVARGDELRQVRYDCSQQAECLRYEAPVGDPLPSSGTPVIENVEQASFVTSGDGYLAVELWVRLPGRSHPIALDDGVFMRNAGV